MIDNAHPDRVATSGFGRIHGTRESMQERSGREERTLADGRRYEIVKHYWHPNELVAESRDHGVALEVEETRHYFLHAHGHLDPSR